MVVIVREKRIGREGSVALCVKFKQWFSRSVLVVVIERN